MISVLSLDRNRGNPGLFRIDLVTGSFDSASLRSG
jgi:hypothetical protein